MDHVEEALKLAAATSRKLDERDQQSVVNDTRSVGNATFDTGTIGTDTYDDEADDGTFDTNTFDKSLDSLETDDDDTKAENDKRRITEESANMDNMVKNNDWDGLFHHADKVERKYD